MNCDLLKSGIYYTSRLTGVNRPIGLTSRLTPAARLFLTLVLLGFPVVLWAAGEQSGPFLFVSSNRTLKDIEIEAKVRLALRQDAQLRPLNLGVHMSDGIAQLSGPVPTNELKQRAVAIVGGVEGVLTISTRDLYISTSAQAGKRMSLLLPDDRPTQTRSASPVLLEGSVVAPRRHSGSRSESATGGTGQQITLLAPEMAAPPTQGGTSVSPVGGTARLTANPHPASPAVSISAAIEHLRRREARYQQIRVQVQGTTVYVFPGDTVGEEAMMFAQAVRCLSGVQHVIIASGLR